MLVIGLGEECALNPVLRMKILYDSQIFCNQAYGGISRYFSEVMRVYLEKGHPTYYRPDFLKLLGKRPFVLTVYDMIHERLSQEFPSYNSRDIADKALLVHRANHIIAISESTRSDLLSIHDIAPEKVSVVPLSSSMPPGTGYQFLDRLPEDIPESYVLFVGDRHAYKNFQRFLRAVTPLLCGNPSLHLVCAGGSPWKKEEKQLMDTLGVSGQCRLYPLVDDDLLAAFYARALCFVFPSLYEGFGIPLLEAFSQGCPVVASRATSFPELAGDAACYFDPRDESSMHEAISGVIRNREFRQVLSDRGMRQLQRFSWEKTAEKHLEVYEQVLMQRRFV